ncbi:ATP-dependent helicase HrpB [Anaerospora hongkongensis]|uniref:ATP-dependent helicase HrpB n=1 Tax=Anaerospora hongkongensis TaxID=244830 RepID=UPI003C770270
MKKLTGLPIEAVLPELQAVLSSSVNAVLVAAPGAGKTTRVPLALLQEPWLKDKRIIMLEPRRLAARAAARYMASLLGEQVGQTVGYRVHLDSRIGPRTRIEVITEGILTRMLQNDPMLSDVGLIIFDEFHERSLQADLGLALALESQAVLRSELRILVMSATLEAQPVAALLNQAPVLVSEGRQFPVETRYLERPLTGSLETAVVQAIDTALRCEEGDILVFLPGAGEIRRVERQLAGKAYTGVRIAVLYGNLPLQQQDVALAPSPAGERKVVLATSIAETSLTVEGVHVVIDAGRMRIPRFSPRTGMTRLETVTVSRASADQRQGRAGRLGPGVCYRLWTAEENLRLEAQSIPEIRAADLVSLVLELAVWGVRQPADLKWLDVPPEAAVEQARVLLRQMGAISGEGQITKHGRQLAEMGLHPRLAHMILLAKEEGMGRLACQVAVLLNERDIFQGGSREADLRLRLDELRSGGKTLDPGIFRRLEAELHYLQSSLSIGVEAQTDSRHCGLLLAFAYPDRIAQRRNDGRFLLQNGRGAVLPSVQALSGESYLVAAELDDKGTESQILLAAPVAVDCLRVYFRDQLEERTEVFWDNQAQAVRGRKRQYLGELLLQEAPFVPDRTECLAALLQGITQTGLTILPWTKAAEQWCGRIRFLHALEPASWPDTSPEALLAALDDWLGPYVYDMSSRTELQRLNLLAALEGMLTWQERQRLEQDAPSHIIVPSGQKIAIDYGNPTAPVLAVRLQELFGLTDTPCIGGGRVPLTLQLLSPARRPVQVTRDLRSFWQTTYFEVRRELLGRYPKHYWPENPLTAQATHRAKPKMLT